MELFRVLLNHFFTWPLFILNNTLQHLLHLFFVLPHIIRGRGGGQGCQVVSGVPGQISCQNRRNKDINGQISEWRKFYTAPAKNVKELAKIIKTPPHDQVIVQ